MVTVDFKTTAEIQRKTSVQRSTVVNTYLERLSKAMIVWELDRVSLSSQAPSIAHIIFQLSIFEYSG